MTRVRTLGVSLALVAASLAFTPSTSNNARLAAKAAVTDPYLTIVGVAAQLGCKTQAREGEEFALGTSFTGLLSEPEKLARFGIRMHEGARVTAGRSAPDKIRVEADEMEPVSARGTATLKVDDKGVLSLLPKP